MSITRLLPNIVTDDLPATRDFFRTLFDLHIEFDSDWYVQFKTPDGRFEFGVIARSSEVTPEAARGASGGWYPTFVVEDADAVYQKAQAVGYEILQPPADTFYGQRRLLVRGPEGTVVDISALIPRA